ncbi:MurR/RpiR family transcriptional regulator [Holdemanella biformis]|uniref:MurR/RpiR family transcriptional regulator n=1 Tax=Holdemanella biformis TaxID=1735 RepID=UPI001C27FCFB|nr:MurR/RpiR family transcriptional regulator [Holdemanella biformis]MBU9896728.1 MurR/RpiR family transcriptional regulator [Holdemanella biformis]MBV3417807.1 MurR/RpiR family transcriptional regulator [Holdemanella biformis]
MKLEKRIELCDSMTPLESEIASYILNNKDEITKLKIQELADILFISKSAIHRFVKKIGFNGFNDLKVSIAKENADLLENNSYINVNYPFQAKDNPRQIAFKLLELYEKAIKDTFEYVDLDQIKAVSQLIDSADVIDVYTHAHNSNIAENFQDKMLTIGRSVNCPSSFYNQRLTVLASDQKHVAIILSYSGKATFILPIVKKLYEKGVKVIQIGKAGSNYYSQYVTYHLSISDSENNRDRMSQFSSHIAMQYIMDVLYGCIYNEKRRKNTKYIYDSIDYMDDRPKD